MAETSGAPLRALTNGGGALSFRLLATALAILTMALVGYEGERMNARLDRIDNSLATTASLTQVHSSRLDTLDAENLEFGSSIHALSNRLDDHEHRISLLEGQKR